MNDGERLRWADGPFPGCRCGRLFKDQLSLALHSVMDCPFRPQGLPLVAATDWSASTPSPTEVVDAMLKEIGR